MALGRQPRAVAKGFQGNLAPRPRVEQVFGWRSLTGGPQRALGRPEGSRTALRHQPRAVAEGFQGQPRVLGPLGAAPELQRCFRPGALPSRSRDRRFSTHYHLHGGGGEEPPWR
eukprot:15453619-Alexandrium_andersonii.AAC.1